MDDGAVDALAQPCGVEPVPVVAGGGREANLVVDHNVDCAPSGKTLEVAHLHHLLVDTLPLEGCVPVEDDGHVLAPVVLEQVLLCCLYLLGRPHLALDHRVDRVQVGGVGETDHGNLTLIRLPE